MTTAVDKARAVVAERTAAVDSMIAAEARLRESAGAAPTEANVAKVAAARVRIDLARDALASAHQALSAALDQQRAEDLAALRATFEKETGELASFTVDAHVKAGVDLDRQGDALLLALARDVAALQLVHRAAVDHAAALGDRFDLPRPSLADAKLSLDFAPPGGLRLAA